MLIWSRRRLRSTLSGEEVRAQRFGGRKLDVVDFRISGEACHLEFDQETGGLVLHMIFANLIIISIVISLLDYAAMAVALMLPRILLSWSR